VHNTRPDPFTDPFTKVQNGNSEGTRRFTAEEGARVLAHRASRPDLAPNAALPEATRLWAALQPASGGTWAGGVDDVELIVERLGR
jgi:xylonate dehydratase